MTWRPSDLAPEARRAAEAAADVAGVPLADWLAATVRSAIIHELGGLPEEELAPDAAEPAPEPMEAEPTPAPLEAQPEPEPEPAAIEATATPARPSPDQRVEPEPIPLRAMPIDGYRVGRMSAEAPRLAEKGFTGWLASRIEGLPTGAAAPSPLAPAAPPFAPAGAIKPAPAPAVDPQPAPARPQLELFSAKPAPPRVAPALPPESAAAPNPIVPLGLPSGPIVTLPVAGLRQARCRSRRAGNDDAVAVLATSVAAQGVREPILVRRLGGDGDSYEVVAGERRRLAAERAGRSEVPAVVVDADDGEALMLSLAENLGRRDFSPLEEGGAYLKLLTQYRVNPSVLAQCLARERTHIVLALRLMGLPERVRQWIDSGKLAPAQAYDLLKAADPEAAAERMVLGARPESAPDPT